MVSRGDHFVECGVQHLRQALAAVRRVACKRRPAALDVSAVSLTVAVGAGHLAVVPTAALQIGWAVDRREHAGRELTALLQDLAGRVHVEFGEIGHLRPTRRSVEHLLDHELHVSQRGVVVVHGMNLVGVQCGSARRHAHAPSRRIT